jgi:hypothetical protein
MASHQGELQPTIRVERPKCGYFTAVALRYAEGDTAHYEGLCESELVAGGLCGVALLVTISLPEEIKEEE